MPEGHTLHRLARQHEAAFAGRPWAASSAMPRFTAGAALLDGRRVEAVEAFGKHLFHRLEGDLRLHVHLGLYGSWRMGSLPAPPVKGALRLRVTSDDVWADLRGPTACELLTAQEQTAIESRLGPDPLRRSTDPALAAARIARSRAPIAALLMDQRVIAGIGNVYRAEILFRAGLGPHLPGRAVGEERFAALWADLVRLMRAGVRAGRIVTTEPVDRSRRGGAVRSTDAHYVYRRAGLPCRRCATPIARELLVGRNLYWCPGCQADR